MISNLPVRGAFQPFGIPNALVNLMSTVIFLGPKYTKRQFCLGWVVETLIVRNFKTLLLWRG